MPTASLTGEESTIERADGSNVLLLAPSMDAHDAEGCAHLLDGDGATNAVLVTLLQSPDDRVDVLRRHRVEPDAVGVVCCDDSARGASAAAAPASTPALPSVTAVSSPADLTGIGMHVSRYLSAWADSPAEVRLCFHSLTVLLQHVDVQRAFRFLHVLTQRVSVSDAVAHYHMDPAAHDPQVVAMMRNLCDVTLELVDDEWVTH